MGHQLVFYFAMLDVNFQMLRTTANPAPLKHDFTLPGVLVILMSGNIFGCFSFGKLNLLRGRFEHFFHFHFSIIKVVP
jgi:hypothetical protein